MMEALGIGPTVKFCLCRLLSCISKSEKSIQGKGYVLKYSELKQRLLSFKDGDGIWPDKIDVEVSLQLTHEHACFYQ